MNSRERKLVYVGMSGGVDSSVTAALLSAGGGSTFGGKERGFDVVGVHIKMWSDESIPCQFKEDRRDALRVAEKLGIAFETWDLTEEYRSEVVNYMIAEYAAGRTPNPDVMCNRKIKFGVFLQNALKRGADFVATGHYVRLASSVQRPAVSGKNTIERNLLNAIRYTLYAAKDVNKDQSYFLWTLTQEQLRHCLFPLGDFIKPKVREMAATFGLSTAEKPDSQGICFIGEINLNEYLKRHIPEARGRIVTTAGKDIGAHDGLAFYTIGQREGLGIGGRLTKTDEPRPKGAGGIPYYVAKKDFATNTLIVGQGPFDEQLFSSVLTAHEVHWISGNYPAFPLTCKARIRYRQPLQDAVVRMSGEGNLAVSFDEPQRAVTPGQSIVFYENGEMLGGGIILS